MLVCVGTLIQWGLVVFERENEGKMKKEEKMAEKNQ